jgi:hypothetical protein
MCSADNSVLNCKIWYENGNKKSNHHHHFFLFLWDIFALLDPDPDSDPKPCYFSHPLIIQAVFRIREYFRSDPDPSIDP